MTARATSPLATAQRRRLLRMKANGSYCTGLAKTEQELAARWEPYVVQPEHVKQALTLMAYQLGVEGELQFKKMLACLERGDTRCAAREATDSQWEHQTPKRVAVVRALLLR